MEPIIICILERDWGIGWVRYPHKFKIIVGWGRPFVGLLDLEFIGEYFLVCCDCFIDGLGLVIF